MKAAPQAVSGVPSDLAAGSWNTPTQLPPLAAHTIHVWRLRPEARLSAISYRQYLQPDELARADRHLFPVDQLQSLASRATLRLLLAHYTSGDDPQTMALAVGDMGKPYMPGSNLHFNVSHTRDLAVFAFAHDLHLGIDVERVHAEDDLDDVAQQNFAPQERAALQALPHAERTSAFYCCWTRKEALLKAEGSGLFRALDSFSVSLGRKEPVALLNAAWGSRSREDEAEWELAHLDVLPDAVGALAWSRAASRPALMLLDWSAALLPQTP